MQNNHCDYAAFFKIWVGWGLANVVGICRTPPHTPNKYPACMHILGNVPYVLWVSYPLEGHHIGVPHVQKGCNSAVVVVEMRKCDNFFFRFSLFFLLLLTILIISHFACSCPFLSSSPPVLGNLCQVFSQDSGVFVDNIFLWELVNLQIVYDALPFACCCSEVVVVWTKPSPWLGHLCIVGIEECLSDFIILYYI